MSEQWIVENDTGAELTVRAPNGFAVELDASSADPRERFAYFAIRQQARDIEQLRAECDLLTHKVICCGVAAWHSDPLLTTTGAYAGKWNSPQADCVRKLRADRDQLRADLAAAVAERDEADNFARHLVREPENIKARAALFAQAQEIQRLRGRKIVAEVARNGAFDENERLRARLAAIELAPTVAVIHDLHGHLSVARAVTRLPDEGTELIARPAKD